MASRLEAFHNKTAQSQSKPWEFWVDTGGTFTDCIAMSPEKELSRLKVMSSGLLRGRIRDLQSAPVYGMDSPWTPFMHAIKGRNIRFPDLSIECQVVDVVPDRKTLTLSPPLPMDSFDPVPFEVDFNEEAPLVAIRLVTGTLEGERLPPVQLRLATTKATNALLEKKGHPPVLFVTEGFEDLLTIGNQKRPDLFSREIVKDPVIQGKVIGVKERLRADGSIETPLDMEAIRKQVEALDQKDKVTAAVALLHSSINPDHEKALGTLLTSLGFSSVSLSATLAPFIRILPRAQTAVVNAYLCPVMDRYLNHISQAMNQPGSGIDIMSSSGGLVHESTFQTKDSLLSGPAGGVIGAVKVGEAAGFTQLIGFDMGGTSTDVWRYEGALDYQFEQSISGIRLLAPSLRIHTVAAGGGSICGVSETGKVFVGPESAGASPGPACYGSGGPLTLTDVNLLSHRMDPARFGVPVSIQAAESSLQNLMQTVSNFRQEPLDREAFLLGLRHIADERMADAIRQISVRQGYDPSEYALIAFGGAGGQHACAVADLLGIKTILCPADTGLLSAWGLRHAVKEHIVEQQILKPLKDILPDLESLISQLDQQALEALASQGVPRHEGCIVRRIGQMRLQGQDITESIEIGDPDQLALAFERRYREIYEYFPEFKVIELVSIRVFASVRPTDSQRETFEPHSNLKPVHLEKEKDGSQFAFVDRGDLQADSWIRRPCIIQDAFSTLAVDPGWEGVVGNLGTIRLSKEPRNDVSNDVPDTKTVSDIDAASHRNPFQLELFTHRFFSIVEEMGNMLERTAVSTNVKERLDFSCALLDAEGHLVTNAPHIPVHLGAMGICVRSLMTQFPFHPGDMIVTNHPAHGGSHLPDITVVAAVHSDEGARIGFIANRAHHAELGGIRPGSMPPGARNLEEEGVVISPTYLYRNGRECYQAMENILTQAAYPTRALMDNLADLRAQAAANFRGINLLKKLSHEVGSDLIPHFMEAIQIETASALKEKLIQLGVSTFTAEQCLDDGSPIRVQARVDSGRLTLDFTGSSEVHSGNFNCTPAIVSSAVIYVMRLFVNQPIPLNEGLMRQVDIQLPVGMLNPVFDDDPGKCPPVVAGNVETSQRIVDTLLLAFEMMACSQGTMNNLIFGNENCSYYETIGGGTGAGEGWHGSDAVHSHMTNTGITDVEILEDRFPVMLRRFAIRQNSGGSGRYRGGNGMLREIEFLQEMQVNLITQHRTHGPYGLCGGQPGSPGKQWILPREGGRNPLPSTVSIVFRPGDRLLIETPGGGGFGEAKEKPWMRFAGAFKNCQADSHRIMRAVEDGCERIHEED